MILGNINKSFQGTGNISFIFGEQGNMLSQNFREHFFKIMGIIGTGVKIFREQGNKDPPGRASLISTVHKYKRFSVDSATAVGSLVVRALDQGRNEECEYTNTRSIGLEHPCGTTPVKVYPSEIFSAGVDPTQKNVTRSAIFSFTLPQLKIQTNPSKDK